jgi:hypothetical protein
MMVVAALAGMAFVVDVPINAQSMGLRVDIPFDFHAGDKVLPSGTYIVEKRGEAIWMSDARGNAAAVLSNAIENKAYSLENLLVFHRYGERRFLSAVCWRDYSVARGLAESKAERRIAKVLPAETVQLAAIVR